VVPINKTYPIFGLYPTISFTQPGASIIANFGNLPLLFDVRSLKSTGFITESTVDKLLHSDSLYLIIWYVAERHYSDKRPPDIRILVKEAVNFTLVSRWWFASITGHNELWRIISYHKWPYLDKVTFRPKFSWYKFYKARVSAVDRNLDCFSIVENCPILVNGKVEEWEEKCPKLYEKFRMTGVCNHCQQTVALLKDQKYFLQECNKGKIVAFDFQADYVVDRSSFYWG